MSNPFSPLLKLCKKNVNILRQILLVVFCSRVSSALRACYWNLELWVSLVELSKSSCNIGKQQEANL